MVGKCGGKVQAQSGEKRAGHSTAGAGDAEKEAERTAGKPGQQMVRKDDRAITFLFWIKIFFSGWDL